jgi:hypothetical protein
MRENAAANPRYAAGFALTRKAAPTLVSPRHLSSHRRMVRKESKLRSNMRGTSSQPSNCRHAPLTDRSQTMHFLTQAGWPKDILPGFITRHRGAIRRSVIGFLFPTQQ